MLDLLDVLKIERAHLLGNSLGGACALRMALERPERIDRLVLLGPGGIDTTRKAPTEGLRHLLGHYLGDGPTRSGGDRVDISAIAGVDTGLGRFAEELKRQLVLEYSLEGAKPSERISIALKRSDLTLHAPTYVPNKF